MNKLILNTANDELIVVLKKENQLFYEIGESKMHHNEAMLPLIDELLTENGLTIKGVEELGVVIGPGSFTGIRVGIATIKAFKDVTGAVAKGVNNLELLYAHIIGKDINIVAIEGSLNSYFVAENVNGKLFIYNRNIFILINNVNRYVFRLNFKIYRFNIVNSNYFATF